MFIRLADMKCPLVMVMMTTSILGNNSKLKSVVKLISKILVINIVTETYKMRTETRTAMQRPR